MIPVAAPKSTINNAKVLRTYCQGIITFQRCRKDYGFGVFLAVLYSLETFHDLPRWEHGSRVNPVTSVTGRIGEIQGFSFFVNPYYDLSANILGGSFPDIYEFSRNQKRFAKGERQAAFRELKCHPRPFVSSEIPVCIDDTAMGVFGHSLVSTPDQDREGRVDEENKKSRYFGPKFHRLSSIFLFLLGSFLVGKGWWNAHYGKRAVWGGWPSLALAA